MKKCIIFFAAIAIMIANNYDCYSQSMYNSFIEEGIARFNSGKYNEAIKIFKAAAADVKATQAEKDNARKWISKCNATKAKIAEEQKKAQIALLEKFILSAESLSVSAEKTDTTILVDAGSPWTLVSYPEEWCEVKDEITGISVKIAENKSLFSRKDTIVLKSTITYSKKQYAIVHKIPLRQAAREKSIASLCINTTPGNAVILVGKEGKMYKPGEVISLEEGETSISVRKTDFVKFDTTMVVLPYDKNKNRNLSVNLIPEFSIVALSFSPEDGTSLSSFNNPTLKVDGHLIDMEELLSDSSSRSFDADRSVEMYKIYKGNLLALPGGKHHFFSMSAIDFEPYSAELDFPVGKTVPYSINLVAKSGTLIIRADNISEGTKVIIDNKIQGEAPGVFRVPKGTHTVTFQKDGYMSKESAYLIEMCEGQELNMDLEMIQCALLSITSNPEGALVFFDGVGKWRTPVNAARITCGYHTIKVMKEGYMPYKETVYLGQEGDSLSVDLQRAYPLEVRSDMPGLHIIFVDRKTKAVYKTDSITNATVQIPYGKYNMELRRYNAREKGKEEIKNLEKQFGKKDLAYKGRVNFNEKKKSIYRLTFRDKFSFIKGNYFFGGVKPVPGYKYMADAGLFNLAFIPGYTTSIVRASLFMPESQGDGKMYLSASCIFLNGEFRIGGAICDCVDVNANISYSWTPNLNKLFEKQKWEIPYICGTDMFLGAEFSTRIKAFNVNVKVGEQLFINSQLNNPISNKGDITYDIQGVKGVQSAFVVGVGFTLGTTRGNRIIRVF